MMKNPQEKKSYISTSRKLEEPLGRLPGAGKYHTHLIKFEAVAIAL
jgi:hypothetical protein